MVTPMLAKRKSSLSQIIHPRCVALLRMLSMLVCTLLVLSKTLLNLHLSFVLLLLVAWIAWKRRALVSFPLHVLQSLSNQQSLSTHPVLWTPSQANSLALFREHLMSLSVILGEWILTLPVLQVFSLLGKDKLIEKSSVVVDLNMIVAPPAQTSN